MPKTEIPLENWKPITEKVIGVVLFTIQSRIPKKRENLKTRSAPKIFRATFGHAFETSSPEIRKSWKYHLKLVCLRFVFFLVRIWEKFFRDFPIAHSYFVGSYVSICILKNFNSTFRACCRPSVGLNNGLFAIWNSPVTVPSQNGAESWHVGEAQLLVWPPF